jgi:Transposase DDE domain
LESQRREYAQGESLFTKAQCQWLPELETYRCPAGQVLKRAGRETYVRSGGREEVVVRYGGKGATCHACPLRPQCTTSQKGGRSIRRSAHEDVILTPQAWLETEEAKAVYRLRGQTIELVFADFKEHRGLRRFSGHGLVRARMELALEMLVYNLLVLHRAEDQVQARKHTSIKADALFSWWLFSTTCYFSRNVTAIMREHYSCNRKRMPSKCRRSFMILFRRYSCNI